MELTDYYQILELPASASMEEIKKSYRRMALAYHPDKNAGDPYAAAQFAVVKEAYETLTDPIRRNQYLQDRWLAKASGKPKPKSVLNPETLLRQMIAKERAVAMMDNHRMNKDGLLDELLRIFNGEAIGMLNDFGDLSINSQIVRLAIRSSAALGFAGRSRLYEQLLRINAEPSVAQEIKRSLNSRLNSERWDRAKIWLLLFVVTAICALIFMVSR
ncbi:MAG: hypothetical protein EOO09_15420 [Chitinophagaceae bacterium]|nr:MAG: hypothetical protein EOO09_15420 [Chitinophagaceae bacterium]